MPGDRPGGRRGPRQCHPARLSQPNRRFDGVGMPGERGRVGDYFVRQRRCAGQVKNMCTRSWLRSTGRTGNSHYQESDGQSFLRGVAGRKSPCGDQAVEENDVRISVRDVGAAKVVEVEGEVDLSTSPDLRRTLL